MAPNDLSTQTSKSPVARGAVMVGGAIVALIVARLIFGFVLTLIKSVLFLAILAAVLWFGYRLLAGSDETTT